MSEDRLVLNTKKSLYEPIEIEIDGQVYQSLKITKSVQKELDKLDEKIAEDNEVLYKITQLLFNVDLKILEKLDKREVQDIWTFSKKKFAEIEKQRLEIINKAFEKIWGPEKKEIKERIPSRKGPGNKR